MKPVIAFLNWLSDQGWSWWPLLKHRPPQHECISNRLVLKMTPFFGTLSGLLIAAIARHLHSATWLLVDIAVGWIAYFTIYRTLFVPAWNSRARRLQNKQP